MSDMVLTCLKVVLQAVLFDSEDMLDEGTEQLCLEIY